MINNRRENLLALKENLKNTIREDAQTVCDFEEKVNDITFEKAGMGRMVADGDFIANRVMGNMCNRIIDSRMSIDDKEYILATMLDLLDITRMGTEISVMSAEERQKAVEEEAENYIKKNEHLIEQFTPTGGTTETHKSVETE